MTKQAGYVLILLLGCVVMSLTAIAQLRPPRFGNDNSNTHPVACTAVAVKEQCQSQSTWKFPQAAGADNHTSCTAGVLLHHLETHIGIVVLITNKPDAIDTAFQRRIRFSMTFPMPDAPLR